MPALEQVVGCILVVLLLGAVNAGITSLVVGAVIFDDLRNRIGRACPLLGDLVTCATCAGTWIAAGISAVAVMWVGWTGVDAVLAGVGLVFGQLSVALLLREIGQFD